MAWQCWASRPRNACNFERQAIYEDTATWGHRHRSHHRHDRRAGSSPGRRRLCDQGDRKSTRLNSSHLVISYAVFCLKKKNNNSHDQLGELRLAHRRLFSLLPSETGKQISTFLMRYAALRFAPLLSIECVYSNLSCST